jgi:protein TonB
MAEQSPFDDSTLVQHTVPRIAAIPRAPQAAELPPTADDYAVAPPEPIERTEMPPAVEPATSPSTEALAETLPENSKPSPRQLPESSHDPVDDSVAVAQTSMTLPQSSATDSPTASSDAASGPASETVAMNHPAIARTGPMKPNYAWLMELLKRRIMSLQAYPHSARVQGWEGMVLVKTTIKSDGSLAEAVVTKSSGYSALDEDALNLMRRVCPIHLTHDLGKPQIAVLIPIRYRLDQ